MEKQFVKYEIALKLKELGFDEVCLAVYFRNKFQLVKGFNINNVDLHVANQMDAILAPLWQQVIDWLVEKYNIYIDVKPVVFDDEPIYIYEIVDLKKGRLLNNINESFIDPNEAREQAILKIIELIENKIE